MMWSCINILIIILYKIPSKQAADENDDEKIGEKRRMDDRSISGDGGFK